MKNYNILSRQNYTTIPIILYKKGESKIVGSKLKGDNSFLLILRFKSTKTKFSFYVRNYI